MSTNSTKGNTIEVYLHFDGRCEEALEYYRQTLGAELLFSMRFKESPEPPSADCQPGDPEKIMHAAFKIGNTMVMASDGRCSGQPKFEGFCLTHNVADEAEADRVFDALAKEGAVHMPLMKTFFSPRFGMVADKFGIPWMVIVAQDCQG